MRLSEEMADALLDRLSSDDEFRATFERDPGAAMTSLGASGDTSCLQVKRLASKEAIAASRDALRRQLVSAQAAAVPISLDATR